MWPMRRKQPGAAIELEITDLAYGGEGVGRHEGQVQFVAGAYPGERVRAEPQSGRKRWQRARLLEVLTPSADRVSPLCSHTEVCGGCVYQTLAYPAQLAAKAKQVREALARIGGFCPPEPEPPLAAPVLQGYRNKMDFSFAPRAWDPAGVPTEPRPDPALGLHVRGRFDAVFDLRDCALCDPAVNEIVARLRGQASSLGLTGYHGGRATGLLRHLIVRSSRATGEHLLALVVSEEDDRLPELARAVCDGHPRIAGFLLWIHAGLASIATAEREILLLGNARITERLLDLEFELSASSFFQTNSSAAESLLNELRAICPPAETIFDLYCGVGTLGLALAGRCRALVGIESVGPAVEDARRNAARNGIAHARYMSATAEDWLAEASALRPDLVILDPPRAGLHPRAMKGLLALAPPRILYVSCNPTTLARDLHHLSASGYVADRMRILDLFPHTPHVETIVLMERREADRPVGGSAL